jgi:hypothetical protein
MATRSREELADEARGLFDWNERQPSRVYVFRDSGTGATPTYGVGVGYGWADRVLASGFYEQDASATAAAIAAVCGVVEVEHLVPDA